MKKVGVGILSVFVAAGCTFGGIQAKKGIDNYIKKQAQQVITEYKQEDRQWTKENYEETISQEQRQIAINSTYQILNEAYYKTNKGRIVKNLRPYTGSSVLLNGNYILTAKHITRGNFKPQYTQVEIYGQYEEVLKYDHNKLSAMRDGKYFKNAKRHDLEKILESENMDYALLKIKDDVELLCYSSGLDLPDKVEIGMQSITIGFPFGFDKNLRIGNISQIKKSHFIEDSNFFDKGEDYLTFKNSIIPGDSGGPIFVVEDGNLKLVAIAKATMSMSASHTTHTNINYGLKISSIVKDLEEQLKSGNLDEETAKEVKTFLKLNKK